MITKISVTDKNITAESGTVNATLHTGETIEIKYATVGGITKYAYDDKYKDDVRLGDYAKISEYVEEFLKGAK